MAELEWYEQDHDYDVTPEKEAEYQMVLDAFQAIEWESRKQWQRASCPFCVEATGRDDYKRSLGYNVLSGKYACFKCESWGYLPISYRYHLEEHDGPTAALGFMQELPPEPIEPADGYAPVFLEPCLSAQSFQWARDYLTRPRAAGGRGLTPEAARAAGIGAVLNGRLAGRIIIPIYDYKNPAGPWRGWVGRHVFGPGADMPYRYSKGLVRVGLLYNQPALAVQTKTPVFVVEGTLDAVSLWPDAVAVLGKPIDSQIDLLCTAKRPVAVALDGDAWAEAQALTWTLRHRGIMAVGIRLPAETDPDDIGKAGMLKLYEEALQHGESG